MLPSVDDAREKPASRRGATSSNPRSILANHVTNATTSDPIVATRLRPRSSRDADGRWTDLAHDRRDERFRRDRSRSRSREREPREPRVGFGGKPRHARRQPRGDWTCACGFRNDEGRRECVSCDRPRPPQAHLRVRQHQSSRDARIQTANEPPRPSRPGYAPSAAAASAAHDAINAATHARRFGERADAEEKELSGSAVPVSSGYAFDPASGYYVDSAAGTYHDPNSGLTYHAATSAWYAWDAANARYVPANKYAAAANDTPTANEAAKTLKSAKMSEAAKTLESATVASDLSKSATFASDPSKSTTVASDPSTTAAASAPRRAAATIGSAAKIDASAAFAVAEMRRLEKEDAEAATHAAEAEANAAMRRAAAGGRAAVTGGGVRGRVYGGKIRTPKGNAKT